MLHLNGTSAATTRIAAGFLWQRQTEVHELVKGMAESMAGRTFQCALQLPSKDVLDDAVAPTVGVLPCLICLLADSAFTLQLLVRGLALHPVQLCLYGSTIAVSAQVKPVAATAG